MGKTAKFHMPTVKEFLKRKRIYNNRRDPVWNYLEREMREMEAKRIKPYNTRVGRWLAFLQKLRTFFHLESKRKLLRLEREVGPAWFTELSLIQRKIVQDMRKSLRGDAQDRNPMRITKALAQLGVDIKFPQSMLLHCVFKSEQDIGLFLWYLFQNYYRKEPSDPLPSYDVNAMLILSAIAYVDMEECIKELRRLTPVSQSKSEVHERKPSEEKKKYYEPKVRYGPYLSQMYVPCFTNDVLERPVKKARCKGPKIRIRNAESYENIAKQNEPACISKRLQRAILNDNYQPRVCTYKFWEAPPLSSADPKQVQLAIKQNMWLNLKLNLKSYMKRLPPYANMPMQISGVTYSPGYPIYQVATFSYLPSPYVIHHGNDVLFKGQYITLISSYYKFPRNSNDACLDCQCLEIWGTEIMAYVKHNDAICRCKHYYDYKNDSSTKLVDQFFHPPTKNSPMWFDHPRIFNFDPWPDVIDQKIKRALRSESTEFEDIQLLDVTPKQLLQAYLSILSNSPLLIPHLPYAHCLHQLVEWVRMRVVGPRTPEQNKKMLYTTQRRWLDLEHIDWRARAYNIPFTDLELKKFNYTHRPMVQDMVHALLHNFTQRNRHKRVQEARLWWPTMKYHAFPSESFLEAFFTYLPSKPADIHVYNPFKSSTMLMQGRTCPLKDLH